MHFHIHVITKTCWRYMLVAAFISLIPLAGNAADATGAAVGSAASDANVNDAILQELKAIREVLEKIQQQGLAGGKQRAAKPTTASISIKDKPAMGSASAPVTVVEFADYQCPFCLRFTRSTFPSLKRDYIDTGKVRWVALNLPLAFHKDARKAAQAAHCAGEQDKFWEMREVLFQNPKKLGQEDLPEHAVTLELDVEAFKACIASDRHLAAIDQDAKDAGAVRLTGTPSFVIGKTASDKITGQVIIGAQPVNVFSAAIKKALDEAARAEPPAAGNKAPGAG